MTGAKAARAVAVSVDAVRASRARSRKSGCQLLAARLDKLRVCTQAALAQLETVSRQIACEVAAPEEPDRDQGDLLRVGARSSRRQKMIPFLALYPAGVKHFPGRPIASKPVCEGEVRQDPSEMSAVRLPPDRRSRSPRRCWLPLDEGQDVLLGNTPA